MKRQLIVSTDEITTAINEYLSKRGRFPVEAKTADFVYEFRPLRNEGERIICVVSFDNDQETP